MVQLNSRGRVLPDATTLRDLIDYDPSSGRLTWKHRDVSRFQDGRHTAAHNCAKWNKRYAGKDAFPSTNRGYKQGRIFGHEYQAHRVAWALHYGEWPVMIIDHIDGNPSNNAIANLRLVTPSGNNKNAKKRSDNTSGVTGVVWNAERGKWQAQTSVSGKFINLGRFDRLEDAVAARKAAEKERGFHANHGR